MPILPICANNCAAWAPCLIGGARRFHLIQNITAGHNGSLFSYLKIDLAYRKMSPVDWCPQCNTTLAREQVWGDDRHCERCDTPVIKKDLNQWFFRITKYADELLNFDGIDWPERVRLLQTNWIGKSEGRYLLILKPRTGDPLEVFTTRPDTLWGVTFMVLAPEHPLVKKLTIPDTKAEVDEYVNESSPSNRNPTRIH